MRQVRVHKECRNRFRHVRTEARDELPLDPRDPDIVRAKRLQRGTKPR
jgi:hypothetical protein